MHAGSKLARELARIVPTSHRGDVARRVTLAGLLTPVRAGAPVADLRFLYAGRRRNRFSTAGGPRSLYMGEDEDIGSAETKRVALLGAFAKKRAEPAAVFWAHVDFPSAVLDLTDASVLAALGTTDAEVHDPDWRERPVSPSELLGGVTFRDGRFAAIKYWSVRARAAGRSGFCLCIFKTRVQAPCRVEFVSAELGLSEVWP